MTRPGMTGSPRCHAATHGEAGVDFVCCDMPSANRLTVHILAAVAEDEARRISERTAAAFAAYKGRVRQARPRCELDS